MNSVGPSFASVLPLLVFQLPCLALYVVGVVRSRGVARILLAIWLGLSFVALALTLAMGSLVAGLGLSGFALLTGAVNLIGSLLLGIALIIGRPGYESGVPRAWPGPGMPTGNQGFTTPNPPEWGQQPPPGGSR